MSTINLPTASTISVPYLDSPGFWSVFAFDKAIIRASSTDSAVGELPAARVIAPEILEFVSEGVPDRVPRTVREAITALYTAYRPRPLKIPGYFAQLPCLSRERVTDVPLADQLITFNIEFRRLAAAMNVSGSYAGKLYRRAMPPWVAEAIEVLVDDGSLDSARVEGIMQAALKTAKEFDERYEDGWVPAVNSPAPGPLKVESPRRSHRPTQASAPSSASTRLAQTADSTRTRSRISDEDRRRCQDEGLCFKCFQPGHRAGMCPSTQARLVQSPSPTPLSSGRTTPSVPMTPHRTPTTLHVAQPTPTMPRLSEITPLRTAIRAPTTVQQKTQGSSSTQAGVQAIGAWPAPMQAALLTTDTLASSSKGTKTAAQEREARSKAEQVVAAYAYLCQSYYDSWESWISGSAAAETHANKTCSEVRMNERMSQAHGVCQSEEKDGNHPDRSPEGLISKSSSSCEFGSHSMQSPDTTQELNETMRAMSDTCPAMIEGPAKEQFGASTSMIGSSGARAESIKYGSRIGAVFTREVRCPTLVRKLVVYRNNSQCN